MNNERFLPIVINPNVCQLCGRCYNSCKNEAIIIKGQKRWVDYKKCTGCMTCVSICPYNAIKVTSAIEGETFSINLNQESCIASNGCSECVDRCPAGIYWLSESKIKINEHALNDCKGCKSCEEGCSVSAIQVLQG